MKKNLFYSFLAMFLVTFLVTILGLTGIIAMERTYLTPLFWSLVLEVVGAVVVLYQKLNIADLDELAPKKAVDSSCNQLRKFEFMSDRNQTSELLRNLDPNTRSIKMLAITALSSVRDVDIVTAFQKLKSAEIKWLLLDPESEGACHRVAENPSRTLEGLKSEIYVGIDRLLVTHAAKPKAKICLRLFAETPVFRLVMIDDVAYVGFYPMGPAKNIPIYRIQRGDSWLFEAAEKHFDAVWTRAKECSLNQKASQAERRATTSNTNS